MTGWNDLPTELRDMVVGLVHDDFNKPRSPTSNPWRSLPFVSREWQSYFSNMHFRTLFLDQDRLDGFERYLNNNKARQHHVKQIFLRVKLPEYDCSACHQPENQDTIHQHNTLFFSTLKRLFSITSKGGWADSPCPPWVTLDIGISSPSDGKHGFRECSFNRACGMLLNNNLSDNIRHLTLYHYTPIVLHFNEQAMESVYGRRRELLHLPIFRSLNNLESLCLSNIADPSEFLSAWQAFQLVLPQSKLRRFVFISRIWDRMDDQFFIKLVLGAGRLAFFNMPDLENMEIWCGQKTKHLFLRFSYTANRQPIVTWSGEVKDQITLGASFGMLAAEIASRNESRRLIVSKRDVDFTSVVDVCRESKDPELILLPESRKQMQYEEEFPVRPVYQSWRGAKYTRL